jgi:hypothetical protein
MRGRCSHSGIGLYFYLCFIVFSIGYTQAVPAASPESAALVAQGPTSRLWNVGRSTASHEISAVVVTAEGPSSATQTTISEESAVIITLKEPPLGSFKRRLKRGDPDRNARIQRQAERLRHDHDQITELIRSIEPDHNGRFKDYRFALNGLATRVKAGTIEEIRRNPLVDRVYNDVEVHALLERSVLLIGAPTLWNAYGATGAGVRVAVIDTGIDYTHPDLGGAFGPTHKVIGGYDFVNGDDDPMDDHGHGTHVAGIVAANGTVKGVAPDARLLAYKVLDQHGSGSFSTVIDGINRALDPDQNPLTDDAVEIITMSLGGPGDPDDAVSQAVDTAVSAGVVCTIAAGNSGAYWTILSPGTARRAITVGASDNSDQIAPFSSRGPTKGTYAIKPDVTAPGVAIHSTYLNHGYAVMSGTSMATPQVAGAAALLLQLHPTWTPDEIKGVLIEQAKDLGQDSFTQGGGRIQPLQSHLAGAVLAPSSINFGLDDLSLGTWSRSESVAVTNLTAAARTYALTVSAAVPAGVTYDIVPASITLAPHETRSVTMTITVDNALLPVPDRDPRAYDGRLIAASSMETLVVPFAFLKSPVLNLSFDVPPWFVFIHDRNNDPADGYGSGLYVAPGPTLSVLLPPRTYDIITVFSTDPEGHFNPETRVVREGVAVDAATTLAISRQEAVHRLILEQVDADRQPLFWDGLDGDDGVVGMNYFGSAQAPGLLTMGYFGRNAVYFSNVSDAYRYDVKLQAISAQTHGAYYEFAYGVNGGITGSRTLTNSTDFKHLTERYRVDPAVDQIWVMDYLLSHQPTWRWGTTGPPTDAAAHALTAPFTREAYYPALPYPGFYVNQTLQRVYRYVGPVFDPYGAGSDDAFMVETAGLGVSDPSTADLYQPYALDSPFLSITGDERLIDAGPPVWSGRLSNDATSSRVSPVWGQSPSLYLSQTGDSDLRYNANLNYELYKGASLVQRATFPAAFAESIPLPSAGAYTLKIPYHGDAWGGYSIHGRATDALATLTFDTERPDRNPPYLKAFRLLADGRITDTIDPSTANRIALGVKDDVGLAGVAIAYDAGGGWQPLALPPVGSGDTYEAVVDLPPALLPGFAALKLTASDASGNTLTYQITPAWYQQGGAPGSAPVAVTSPATRVGRSTATLHGVVSANGVGGTAWFEWGASTAYGSTTRPQRIAGSTVTNAAAHLSRLEQNVTYHYRIVARNSGGTTYGADMVFRPQRNNPR